MFNIITELCLRICTTAYKTGSFIWCVRENFLERRSLTWRFYTSASQMKTLNIRKRNKRDPTVSSCRHRKSSALPLLATVSSPSNKITHYYWRWALTESFRLLYTPPALTLDNSTFWKHISFYAFCMDLKITATTSFTALTNGVL
jgi:hypothetical protein